MNKYDEMLELYIDKLIPPCELLEKLKLKIDNQIKNSEMYSPFDNHIYSENVLNTSAYRRTAEIFKKAFSVLENYNVIFCEGKHFPIYVNDEAI